MDALTPEQILAEANYPGLFSYDSEKFAEAFGSSVDRPALQNVAVGKAQQEADALRSAGFLRSSELVAAASPSNYEDKYNELRAEVQDAHNRITWATSDLAWASDGSITSAANQVEAYAKRILAQRDSARIAVEAIQNGIPGVLEEILSHPSMAATRTAINEALQSLVNKAVAGAQHHRYRNLEFDYPTEPIATDKEN